MGLFNDIATLAVLAALFAYLNYRFLRLPHTIGVMLLALLMSLLILAAGRLGLGDVDRWARHVLHSFHFSRTLLHGMLSLLLFAAALHVDLEGLRAQRLAITLLTSLGMLISTLVVGGLTWLVLDWVGLPLTWAWCLLFGALISPTDPVAVLSIVQELGLPASLQAQIAGESLFNDGMGVVLFLSILARATGHGHLVLDRFLGELLLEAGGGVVLGLVSGLLAYAMLRRLDNYQVEVLITLALAMGVYALGFALGVSAPVAVVVAGLFIGNHGRLLAMSAQTRRNLDTFWELVDEILNALLFVLIGLEILVLSYRQEYLLAALLVIPTVLLARLISVGLPIGLIRLRRRLAPHTVKILSWGGVRGGISIALALSLPHGEPRNIILPITYATVVFSVLVQGLSLRPLLQWRWRAALGEAEDGRETPAP